MSKWLFSMQKQCHDFQWVQFLSASYQMTSEDVEYCAFKRYGLVEILL